MLDFFTQHSIYGALLFLVLGLVAGRVGSVLVYAVQDDSGQIKVNFVSFFIKCQKAWGYLPVFYFLKKLKHAHLPVRPLLIELIMAFLFVALFYKIGWHYVLLEYSVFIFGLVVASTIDLERMILPDFLTLSGIVLALAGAVINPESTRVFWSSFFGMLMGGGFLWLIAVCYYSVRGKDGIGGGDIKLLAWIGAMLTWQAIPIVILLSCFFGMCVSLTLLLKVRKHIEKATNNQMEEDTEHLKGQPLPEDNTEDNSWFNVSIPFGPYLSLSALIYIFFGSQLSTWYLSAFIHPVFL